MNKASPAGSTTIQNVPSALSNFDLLRSTRYRFLNVQVAGQVSGLESKRKHEKGTQLKRRQDMDGLVFIFIMI